MQLHTSNAVMPESGLERCSIFFLHSALFFHSCLSASGMYAHCRGFDSAAASCNAATACCNAAGGSLFWPSALL
jgi:hypothetical protein